MIGGLKSVAIEICIAASLLLDHIFSFIPTMADSASSTAATDPLMNSATDKVPFFKKRSTKKNLRKRKADTLSTRSQSDDDDDDDDGLTSQVVTKNRKHTATPFVQSTRRGKKRREHGINDDDEEEQDDFVEKIGVQYAADRSARMQKSDATRYSTEWELENEELAKRKQAGPQAKKATNSKMQVGPQRAPANIRVTARFDYQPDVCKDYKGKRKNIEWMIRLAHAFFMQKRDSVVMVIHVSFYTIVVITRLDGN